MRDALLGVQRFSDFKQSLGVARNILADRLRNLVEDNVLARLGPERRPIYVLTDKGRALAPALVALMQWGDAWVSKNRPPIVVTAEAGHKVDAVRLQVGGRPLKLDEVCFEPGSGAAPRTREFLAMLSHRPVERQRKR